MDVPKIIEGGNYSDCRGIIRFVNDFTFEEVKRFYFIRHPDTSVIRAWQGHKYEKKLFYPIKGRFIVAWVEIDDFENPSDRLNADFYILNEKRSEILAIPKGYANGLKALDSKSEIMVLSDMELEESKKEKKRYPANNWLNWEEIEQNINKE